MAVANVVASTYYAGYGRQWYAAASKAKPVIDGEALLPEELGAGGVRNAMLHMNMTLLAAYTRLKFQDRIEAILDEMADLRQLDTCDAAFAEAQISDRMRPWIYRGIFDYLKRRDEIAAYKFSIRALELGRKSPNAAESLTAGLAKWVTEDSKYVFKCPTCGDQEVDPTLPACTVCRLPNLEFVPEARPPR